MSWIKLDDILKNVEHTHVAGHTNTYVAGLNADSRRVRPNTMFFALNGNAFDGNEFIPQAVDAGATVIVTENNQETYGGVTTVVVPDIRSAMAQCAKNFYGDPSNRLTVIGVTGTNGKTTVSYLIEHILLHNVIHTGVMGTIENRFADYFCRSWMTTPESPFINYLLDRAVTEGIDAMVMEVSSHGIKQKRIEGIEFDVAVFTNLSHEHLDYHENYDEYCECKARLFASIKKREKTGAVVNSDDDKAEYILSSARGKSITYGIKNNADLKAQDIRFTQNGTEFILIYQDVQASVNSPLIGIHNVYNLLAAIGACCILEMPLQNVVDSVSKFEGVPGRLEKVCLPDKPDVYVDYAHTDDALKHVLQTIRSVYTGAVHVVFGCGGNRDKTKRAPMGRVATSSADFVYITSDNPRLEDPHAIIEDIVKGCAKSNYQIIPDRKKAIETAIKQAKENDVVIIAGKGHEQYQIIGTTSFPFDDKKIAAETLDVYQGAVS